VVGLIAIAALVSGGRGGEPGADSAELSEQISALREALAEERRERVALQQEFGELRAQLARAQTPARAASATAPAQIPAPAPSPIPEPAAEAGEARPRAFDPQRIIAAGFSPSDVERFRSRVSSLQLDRLYLRDQAQREGWLDSPSFETESRRIDEELAGLREDDEQLYDWMLFAQGQPNRVAVTEVLAGSAAESAGLEPGDLIVRYDGALILSPGDLRGATSAGQAGTQVEVELQRQGERVRVFLPRGPVGVAVEAHSLAPGR
jgi:hypothetical protein